MRRCIESSFHRAVRESRPDVVYSVWAYPDGWAAADLSHRAGLPVVIKVVGSDVLTLDGSRSRLRRTLEALRSATSVLAVSRDLAERLISHGIDAKKIRVVYNGLDVEVFRPGSRSEARARLGLPEQGRVILFAGNLVSVKQVDVLIEACARIAGSVEFHCHLLGDGPLRGSLEALVRTRGLTERVTFHGSQPQQRLPDWYRASDVVTLPSRSEGIPNVLLEAHACGIPFVASRVGGIPEIGAGDRCRLVPPGDVDAFAAALAETLAAGSPPPTKSSAVSWDDSARDLEDALELARQASRT